jgi:hypothetical protein
MLQLMLQPTLRLMLQQTFRPMLLAMPLTTQPTLPTSREMPLQTQAQPPPVQVNRAEGSQHHHIRDEVEIAQRANYPDALDANNPIQAVDL